MNPSTNETEQTDSVNNTEILRPIVGGDDTKSGGVSTQQKETEEEKEHKRLLENPQVQLFLKYFYDKEEKTTFGNRVRSYIKAYNLDEKEKYKSAGTLSSRLLKKVGKSARDYLEESGWGLETLLELNIAKAASTNNAKYLDMLYEMAEYKKDPKAAVIQNNQFNIMTIDQQKAEVFTNKLLDFLENA